MSHAEKTVGELVMEKPARARVFEKLGIDYCCGGKVSLRDACASNGLDANSVLATLNAIESVADQVPAGEPDPATMSLTQLCDHIVDTHHAYLRQELPRLQLLLGKVVEKHGPTHPWVVELSGVLQALSDELNMHMMKEEQILFPAIRDKEAGRRSSSPCGEHLEGPISVMEHEHQDAGIALERMRQLSSDYTVPEDACNTFRALLDSLVQLEADLHQHIHKENNILFPRALEP